jgi:uncharacterized protein YqeY
MSLKQKIQQDLKLAMKSGDTRKRDALRMLDSMIKNSEIEKKKKEDGLADGEIQEVVARAIKQRKDAAEQYAAGGRAELAEKEEKEVEILLKYMPKQMGEEEIRAVVREIISKTGASSPADMGKVMGAAMSELKSKADGQIVKKAVEEELAK